MSILYKTKNLELSFDTVKELIEYQSRRFSETKTEVKPKQKMERIFCSEKLSATLSLRKPKAKRKKFLSKAQRKEIARDYRALGLDESKRIKIKVFRKLGRPYKLSGKQTREYVYRNLRTFKEFRDKEVHING